MLLDHPARAEPVVLRPDEVAALADLAGACEPGSVRMPDLERALQLVVELDLAGGQDHELVRLARAGDERALRALLAKYRPLARGKARSYFLVGADREDVVQEGMIGLYKAIRDFDPDMQTSFRAFAEMCVTRQVITAVKSATRQKHGPLNNYLSFSSPVVDGDDAQWHLSEVLRTPTVTDPAELVVSAERVRALQALLDEVLSDLETQVLRLHVEGRTYQEIAESLQRHVKSIDNALQRIKKKLEGQLQLLAAADAG